MLAASVAAEALLFPVGALLFARVTFAGLALNFLAIPLMAVAQVAGMAVVPLALISSALPPSPDGWPMPALEGWCGRPISSGSRPQSPGASPLRNGAWWSRTTRRWWCAGLSGGGDPR